MMVSRWSTDVWRRKIIKRYKRRASKFYNEAETIEEKEAWGKVITWFNTILNKSRLNKNEAIALPLDLSIDELIQDSLLKETEK